MSGGEQELPKMDGTMDKKKPASLGSGGNGNPPPGPDGKHRPGTGKEVRKPRHSARRMRFRQAMFSTSKHLNILEEGEEGYGEEDEFTEFGATECTSRISRRDDNSTFFSIGSSLYSVNEGKNGCCSVRKLLVALCLIVVGGGVGGVLFFTGVVGGGGGSSSDSNQPEVSADTTTVVENMTAAAIQETVPPTQVPADLLPDTSGSSLYQGIDYTTFDPAVMAVDAPPLPLEELLPPFTLQALEDASTPQSLALQWVQGHPSYETMPNWKKLQLMALASFYYAFKGESWPIDKRRNWLSYGIDECDWGDKGVDGQYLGVACTTDGELLPGGAPTTTTASITKTTPSTNGGLEQATSTTTTNRRYTDLNLDWFLGFGSIGYTGDDVTTSVGGKANQMPPEIVFLQDLQSLGLMNCGLKATLAGLVPPTLVQLPHLTRLSYRFNNIGGSIPDTLGELTNLEYLSLGSNYLTGTLPSSLGGLTRVKEFFLYSNQLEGSIPYNWNKLTALREFSAISNEITGKIPSFVGDWLNLEFFFIDHNPLAGAMPTEICALPNLTSILLPCSVGCAKECGETCECYEN